MSRQDATALEMENGSQRSPTCSLYHRAFYFIEPYFIYLHIYLSILKIYYLYLKHTIGWILTCVIAGKHQCNHGNECPHHIWFFSFGPQRKSPTVATCLSGNLCFILSFTAYLQYLSFFLIAGKICLLSLSVIILRLIHIVCANNSFILNLWCNTMCLSS